MPGARTATTSSTGMPRCSWSAAATRASLPRARRRPRASRRCWSTTAPTPSRSRASKPSRAPRSASSRAGSSRSTRASSCYRYRARNVVVAAGGVEQPLLFPGNDLVGVVLPETVRRLVGPLVAEARRPRGRDHRRRRRAWRRSPYLERAGTEVAEVVDLRQTRVRQIAANGRAGRLASVELDGRKVACDLLVMSGGRQPAYALLAHAGAKVEYDHGRGIFVPTDLPDGHRGRRPGRGRRRRSRGSRRDLQRRVRGRASASSASARTSPTRTSSARSPRASTRSSWRSATRP